MKKITLTPKKKPTMTLTPKTYKKGPFNPRKLTKKRAK